MATNSQKTIMKNKRSIFSGKAAVKKQIHIYRNSRGEYFYSDSHKRNVTLICKVSSVDAAFESCQKLNSQRLVKYAHPF